MRLFNHSLWLLIAILFIGCSKDGASSYQDPDNQFDPIEIVEISPDIFFKLSGNENIVKDEQIDGAASLQFNYINGYGRQARITVKEEHEWIDADLTQELAQNEGESTISIPLYGTPRESGRVELTVSIMLDGSTVLVKTYSVNVLDSGGETPTLAFEEITTTQEFVKGVALTEDASISLDYTGSLAQSVDVEISGLEGVSASTSSFILTSGEGTLTIPIQGTPSVAGDATLSVTITPNDQSVAITKSIDLVVGVQNPLEFNTPTIEGDIYQGTPIEGYSLKLNYKNGLGRVVTPTFTINSESGISVSTAESTITLEQGEGEIELIVSGDSPAVGTHKVNAQFSYDGDGSPVETSFDIFVNARAAIEFDLTNVHVTGIPLVVGLPTQSDKSYLTISYINGWGRSVAISVSGQATSTETTYTLKDDNSRGEIMIPLSGTPSQMQADLIITVAGEQTTINNFYAGEKVTHNGLDYYTVFVDLDSDGVVESGEQWLDRNLGATSNDPGTNGNYLQNNSALGSYFHYGISQPVEMVEATKGDNSYLFAQYTQGYSYPADLKWEDVAPEGYRLPTREEFGRVTDKYLGTKFFEQTPNNIFGIQKYADASQGTRPVMAPPLRFAMGGLMIATAVENHNDVPGGCTAFWTGSLVDNDTNPTRIFFQGDQIDIGKTTELRANIRCVKAD